MKTYKVDTKEIVWHRSEYQVEDYVTPEELYKMIQQNEINAVDHEGYIIDTAELMLTRDNDGESTVEIISESYENKNLPLVHFPNSACSSHVYSLSGGRTSTHSPLETVVIASSSSALAVVSSVSHLPQDSSQKPSIQSLSHFPAQPH